MNHWPALLLLTTLGCTSNSLEKSETSETTTDNDTTAESGTTDGGEGTDTAVEGEGSCLSTTAEGWTEASHAKGADPDYARIFDETGPLRLDIRICADDWERMQADLENFRGGGGGPGDGGPPPAADDDPIYVPAEVALGGQTWPWVGMRYKGNSSLARALADGSTKLPFRIDFDRYEDSVLETENQRFFGFSDIKASSAYLDNSLIRDHLAADVFAAAGVPVARGRFAEVWVDVGEGPVYWGIYTLFEDPCDEMPAAFWGSAGARCFKADGTTANLTDVAEADFEVKDGDTEDWTAIQALVDHLATPVSNETEWVATLEQHIDVDGLLRALAVNALIGNWDSYGEMTHNYYLREDDAGRLSYIPWDFNESFMRHGTRDPLDVPLDEAGSDWPLIRAVLDVPSLNDRYAAQVLDLTETVLSETNLAARAEALLALVASGAAAETAPQSNLSSYSAFEAALTATNDGVLTAASEGRTEAQAWLTGR